MTLAVEDPTTKGMSRQDALPRLSELQRSRPNSTQGGFVTAAGAIGVDENQSIMMDGAGASTVGA